MIALATALAAAVAAPTLATTFAAAVEIAFLAAAAPTTALADAVADPAPTAAPTAGPATPLDAEQNSLPTRRPPLPDLRTPTARSSACPRRRHLAVYPSGDPPSQTEDIGALRRGGKA